MAVAIESLPRLFQQRWNLRNMGGDAMRAIVDHERNAALRNARNLILELGNDERLSAESTNPWEKIARDFLEFTRVEAGINSDLKAVENKMPDRDEVELFISQIDLSDKVEIVQGCPSRPEDKRLAEMITVSLYSGGEIVSQIHMSPVLEKDRRYSTKPGATNKFQQVALDPDGRLRDVVTGNEVDINNFSEKLPNLDLEDMAVGDLMIYMSRYILNIVRGLHFINKWGIDDEWMPYVSNYERSAFLAVAHAIPDFIKQGKVSESEKEEFRQRMMASFLINPKLFTNLVIAFDMYAVFPFFDEIAEKSGNRMSHDLSMPKSREELVGLVHETMGEKYDQNMSVLGNVAKMFGIGRFRWEDEGMLY